VHIVRKIHQQDILPELIERNARVSREPVVYNFFLRFHKYLIPLFHVNIFKNNFTALGFTLKYPSFDVRVKNGNGETMIFDIIRKKWLILTPEEWVRQHVLNYLITEKKYPASTISVEKEIVLNDIKKRFDIVVYNNKMEPALMVECKAPYIELDTAVIEQVKRYNLVMKAPLIMVTNGISDLILDHNNTALELPVYTNHIGI
jgi:hypothetical protein